MTAMIPDEVRKQMSEWGKKGGPLRAKKYSKKQLSIWAKMGGRPKGSKNKKVDRKVKAV